jgi:hypothetical protein
MIEIKPQVLAGQMRRQAWPLGSHSRCLGCRRWKRGFDPRDVGVEVVEAELQLIVVEPFGTPAKLAALQLLNDEPEPFDLRLCLSEIDAFGCERPDHPLQRLYIIWLRGPILRFGNSLFLELKFPVRLKKFPVRFLREFASKCLTDWYIPAWA